MAVRGLDVIRETFEASTDLSANPNFIFITLDSNDQLVLPSAGAPVIGILENTRDLTAAGHEGAVALTGKMKVVAGGTINAGDRLTPDANGAAVVATAATVDTTTSVAAQDVDGDAVAAMALSDAASGDVFEVLLTPGGALV